MLRAIAQDNEEDLLAALDLPGVDIKEGIVESDVEDRDTSVDAHCSVVPHRSLAVGSGSYGLIEWLIE